MYSTCTDQQRVEKLSQGVLHLMNVIEELQIICLACQRASDAEDWDDLRHQLRRADHVFEHLFRE